MSETTASTTPISQPQTRQRKALYSPLIDFLLLGGGSLLVLPFVALIPGQYAADVLFATFVLSFAINYPHFAHSYQIFYRDFANKVRGQGYPRHLQIRYAFAGVAVPVLLMLGFAAAYWSQSAAAMGLAANAMGFFVGWHYVKQGYGLLIVDSVLQRSFFGEQAKKVFRGNAYACWIFFFLLASRSLHDKDFLGLKYYFIEVPTPLLWLAGLVMAATTLWALYEAWNAERAGGGRIMPLNGYIAYVVSIYIWLAAIWTTAVLYVIPAFHSLQYLAVVWRYEFNRQDAVLSGTGAPEKSLLWVRLATFIGIGYSLGAAGFWLIPKYLDTSVSYDQVMYGGALFSFMILIFINIHHYFLDNVMWRKDNPDVSRHLFGAGKSR
jgi:hypothetical protein